MTATATILHISRKRADQAGAGWSTTLLLAKRSKRKGPIQRVAEF